MDEWYYTQNGAQAGPVPGAVLQQLAASGQLQAGEHVWKQGMEQWVPASSVPGLFGGAAIAQPVPSPYAGAMPAMTPGVMWADRQGVSYAGFWLRAIAWVIDIVVANVISFAAGFVAGCAMAVVGVKEPLVGGALGLISTWLYFALMESGAGQATLGKRALGLRVTDEVGQRISFARATGRYFGKIISAVILLIGFMLAGWTEKKQALHDMMAGTLVIRTNQN